MSQENIFFLFLHKNIYCGYSLAAPWRGTSNEYHNICYCGDIRQLSTTFGPKIQTYRIRPNNHTVHLDFSKLLEKTCSKIVS